jgi:multidrug efflux pump subunit AcrA (membrane-fusion protein)
VVTATLDAYPDWKIPCKVIAIIPTADRQKATVKVRIGFDHLDPRILPEMGIKVAFQEPTPEPGDKSRPARRLTIPKAALRNDNGKDVAFVVEDGHARQRSIKVAGRDGDRVEVQSGLAAGERVIVNAPENLRDEQLVKENKP